MMCRLLQVSLCAAGLLFTAAAGHAMDVRLVDGAGKPVQWGQNTVPFGNPPKTGSSFQVDMGRGSMLVAGMFILTNDERGISSTAKEVTVGKQSITINVDAIDKSLRCATALAWANETLYVAEIHSNDDNDRYVYTVTPDGKLAERFTTVRDPIAIAVSQDTLYVLGKDELAAYALADKTPRWNAPINYGAGFHQMALLKDKLYISDCAGPAVRIVNAMDGKEIGQITGAGDAALKVEKPGIAGIGVAALPCGNLLISDDVAVREFTPAGDCLRKLLDLKGGTSCLAVDAQGNFALACPRADKFGSTRVNKYDARGRQLAMYEKTGWGELSGKGDYHRRYLGGIYGKILSPGGLAFDAKGSLYISDRNDVPKSDSEFRGMGTQIENDGGIARFNAKDELDGRLGSRFTSGEFIKQRLALRADRKPFQVTAGRLRTGGRLGLVVSGDSISQVGGNVPGAWNGGASALEKNWVYVLGKHFETAYPGCKAGIDSRGIGGTMAYNGLCRAPQPERPDTSIDLYLIEYGTNEILTPWMTPEAYAQALREFITMVSVYSDCDLALVTVGLITIPDLPFDAQQYVDAAINVGKEYNVPVINEWEIVANALHGQPYTTLHLGDQPNRKPSDAHPNDAGHQVWADGAFEMIRKALETPPAAR